MSECKGCRFGCTEGSNQLIAPMATSIVNGGMVNGGIVNGGIGSGNIGGGTAIGSTSNSGKTSQHIVGPTTILPAATSEFQQTLLKTIVQPAYVTELKENVRARLRWRDRARLFFWLSNLFVLLSSIFSWLQTQFKDITYWSVGAGVSNVLILIFLNFSSQATKEEACLTRDLNEVLANLGMQGFPESYSTPSTGSTTTVGSPIQHRTSPNVISPIVAPTVESIVVPTVESGTTTPLLHAQNNV